MASPEINGAALRSSGSPDCSILKLSGPLRGWKKKLTSEKGCAQKRKDVSYIAPNGEEIKSSRHLIRYLKAHPGGLKAENFVWETVKAPRRSARLNRKPGRRIHFEELDMIPTRRRKRSSSSNGKDKLKSGRIKKRAGISRARDNLKVAKEKLLVDSQLLQASELHPCTLQNSHPETKAVKTEDTKNLENINSSQVDNQILAVDVTEVPDLKIPLDDKHITVGGIEEAVAFDEQIPLEILFPAADSLDASVEGMPLTTDMVIEFEETPSEIDNAKVERSIAVDNATVDTTATSIMTALPETTDPENETDEEVKMNDVTKISEEDKQVVEEILKGKFGECTTEEIVEKAFDMDVDTLDDVNEITMIVQVAEDLCDNRIVLSQPQIIHPPC
ncbi:uncharacterized protein [Physcomitrium patens]|uniref:MBD domain-containing protein n=1 Tax=Physcomitrium patens TaxID=3218 RepID=A0A2K1J339_PHYPA|nr:methyl-CpG-binding domain-containing protein 10-like isoform X1 [Physcomitrium patens]PNR35948.1 hypothetical protein PHYPA_021798 [Physcomitrium patens]|eukprot:XP_024400124.1 methyl-CpG-binding domain-containing protein 10-like isoform X1 [Physcomitrella patens]